MDDGSVRDGVNARLHEEKCDCSLVDLEAAIREQYGGWRMIRVVLLREQNAQSP